MLITIFTPTYNRANLLPRLYKSLIEQTGRNFEWIIVDDGSTDNTREVVDSFISENKISIIFFKKENEGKHLAINKGVELASGELFFIVDSDDYLMDCATSVISNNYSLITDRNDLAGISFRRGASETEYIGTKKTFTKIEASALDFRYRFQIVGDMAEVFKTNVLKQYPFPKINQDRFCPEALVWNRIAKSYKMLWISKIIYICEYLEGGLTDNIFKIRKGSPETTLLFYKELQTMPIPLVQKVRGNVNYWRFAKFSKRSFISKFKEVNFFYSLFGMPLSLIFILKDPK